MDALPRRSAFSGTATSVRPLASAFAGQARFSGCMTLMSWPARVVASLLPPELELAGRVASAADEHPVALLFGTQAHTAVLRAGFVLPIGPAYREFGLAIPYVRHRRGSELHTYMARMYSSYFPAAWEGNQRYFSKAFARMEWHGPLFAMTDEHGTLLFHASVEPAGSWVGARDCELPSFAAVTDAFALPIVGRRADGSLAGSLFAWSFDDAVIRPGRAYVSIDAPLVNGLRPGHDHDASRGTFEVRDMLWRLSWPMPLRF